jgi:competence protein ComGC
MKNRKSERGSRAAAQPPFRAEAGLTLVEILLSLVIMVLGVVGILALFPPALQQSRESVEETTAAMVAESVSASLKNAIQFANYDVTNNRWTCVLVHDLKSTGQVVRFTFNLPSSALEKWKHFPSAGSPDPGKPPSNDPSLDPYFNLGGDAWVHAAVERVHEANDPTDGYKQFAFSFRVMKIDTLAYLIGTPNPPGKPPLIPDGPPYTQSDVDKIEKIYEFQINVFRTATQMSASGGGTGTGGGSGTASANLVATVTHRVATR